MFCILYFSTKLLLLAQSKFLIHISFRNSCKIQLRPTIPGRRSPTTGSLTRCGLGKSSLSTLVWLGRWVQLCLHPPKKCPSSWEGSILQITTSEKGLHGKTGRHPASKHFLFLPQSQVARGSKRQFQDGSTSPPWDLSWR